VPAGVDLARVRQDLAQMEGVREVHDLHVWSIGSGMIALTAHVVADPSAGSHDDLLHRIDHRMRHDYGIHHSTVQVESPGFPESRASTTP
jgi:cobalt-zinc-cadmium efflux system protein